jgi:hypothetical protein
MKNLLKILPIIALLVSACGDEFDEFEDTEEFRPAKAGCPPCFVGGNHAYLGISTNYNPANITSTSLTIQNAGGSETRNYGTSYTIPNDPNTVTITDNELCTVGTTGQAPTKVLVEFVIGGAAPTTIYEEIDLVQVPVCP